MRYITGCISYMLSIVSVNTIAECLRTDCNSLGDKKGVVFLLFVRCINSCRVMMYVFVVMKRSRTVNEVGS